MCRRVDCSKCSKPTWAGCGMHIESALAGVAETDRCACPRDSACNVQAATTTPTDNLTTSYNKLLDGLQ